jgi:hypothetical protein
MNIPPCFFECGDVWWNWSCRFWSELIDRLNFRQQSVRSARLHSIMVQRDPHKRDKKYYLSTITGTAHHHISLDQFI